MAGSFPEADVKASVALLSSINVAMGQPEYLVPPDDLGPGPLLKLAETLRAGRYRPEAWFRRGPERVGVEAVPETPPPLAPGATYLTVNLPVREPSQRFRSVGAGGVLFEDPFYALLACHNASRGKPRLVIPFAREFKNLWQRRRSIIRSVREKTYEPAGYFAEALPIDGDQPPPLKVQPIGGGDLQRLRDAGAAVLLLDKARGMAEYRIFFPDLSPG
jgi:hypothetical protein